MVSTSISMQDLLPNSLNRTPSSKEIMTDSVMPFVLVPILLLIATISYTVTIIIMVVIGMAALYVYSRPRQKNKSPFFLSWTLASAATLLIIYNVAILRYFEITRLENAVFLLLVGCTGYFFYKMRRVAQFELALGPSKGKEYSPVITSESKYCPICQLEVNERYFHTIWWDCCVFRPNYKYFLAGQVFAFTVLLVGTHFGLTTICYPYVFYDPILMPEDCSGVYDDFKVAISFVGCVYALGYLLVVTLILLQQVLVYIPKYCEPQWRRLSHVIKV